MRVEVVIPEEYMGDIMGNITSRRGRVEGMEARGNAQVVVRWFHLLKCSDMQHLYVQYTRSRSILNGTLITMKKFQSRLLKK